MTTESSENGAITPPRMNVFGYAGYVTMFSRFHTKACCLIVGFRVWLVSDYAHVFLPLSVLAKRHSS